MTDGEYAALFQHEEELWWFVGMRRLVDLLLESRLRPGMRTLEAGCGAGYNALDQSRRYGWNVFPCDYSTHALRYSKQRGVPHLAGADVEHLPYADAGFDCVTCFDVLVMFDEVRLPHALAEFRRVLRPGGLLVTRMGAFEALRGHHSKLNAEARRYTLPELREHFSRAGFVIERATYANTLLTPIVWLKRRVLEPLHIVDEQSDVSAPPEWLSRLFLAAMDMERKLIQSGVRMPFGTSTVVMARKPIR
jgi:SAM-dependent methyltransferase